MKKLTTLALAAVFLGAASTTLAAQGTPAKRTAKPVFHKTKKAETEADLAREAKVSKDSATAIALARVPGAKVQSAEIERENGRLIWSFDLKTAGKSGIDEVNVNALTGKVVGGTQHETPKTERKEAKQEAKEKKTKK